MSGAQVYFSIFTISLLILSVSAEIRSRTASFVLSLSSIILYCISEVASGAAISFYNALLAFLMTTYVFILYLFGYAYLDNIVLFLLGTISTQSPFTLMVATMVLSLAYLFRYYKKIDGRAYFASEKPSLSSWRFVILSGKKYYLRVVPLSAMTLPYLVILIASAFGVALP